LKKNSVSSNSIHTQNSSSDYSSVLQTYIRNLRFNSSTTPKPFLIITAAKISDVQAAVTCGTRHNLLMKTRSGGHDYEGLSYVSKSGSPFFVLDMFRLRSVEVHKGSETAYVQAGATLGEVYYKISEKSQTLGYPAGVCPTVGVGGHISGGGYGNMMRKYGLTVDNVVDAELVDVDGKLLDRKSMGEDVFWAICGGGASSFGVVVSYTIKLVPVPEIVTVFRVEKRLDENATDIVYKWEQVASKLHEDLFIRLIVEVVNQTGREEKTVKASFLSLFLGNSSRLLSIMNKSFPELGLTQSDCIETSWVKSVLYWTNYDIKTTLTSELLNRTPQSLNYLKRKSDYVKTPIPKDGLEKLWKKMIELMTPSMIFNPYGGKMGEISSTEKPFPHRAGNLWKIQYVANWNEGGDGAEDRYLDLTRKLFDFMTPYVSKNPREAFLNYRDLDIGVNHNNGKEMSYEEGKVYGIKYFKGNFKKLVTIKTKVDPQNFFRNEQSIPRL
jgi:hypothetical protein